MHIICEIPDRTENNNNNKNNTPGAVGIFARNLPLLLTSKQILK